jgi:hypothetical protein
MGKGESKALVGMSHARTCGQVFLPRGRRNLNQANPRIERRRKIVLMLHDDFQHLRQTRGMIAIAEREPVRWGTRWPLRRPVFANKAPFATFCQVPNPQIRPTSSRRIFDMDQASLRRGKEIRPTQYHRTFQDAVELNSHDGRSMCDALHGIFLPSASCCSPNGAAEPALQNLKRKAGPRAYAAGIAVRIW